MSYLFYDDAHILIHPHKGKNPLAYVIPASSSLEAACVFAKTRLCRPLLQIINSNTVPPTTAYNHWSQWRDDVVYRCVDRLDGMIKIRTRQLSQMETPLYLGGEHVDMTRHEKQLAMERWQLEVYTLRIPSPKEKRTLRTSDTCQLFRSGKNATWLVEWQTSRPQMIRYENLDLQRVPTSLAVLKRMSTLPRPEIDWMAVQTAEGADDPDTAWEAFLTHQHVPEETTSSAEEVAQSRPLRYPLVITPLHLWTST